MLFPDVSQGDCFSFGHDDDDAYVLIDLIALVSLMLLSFICVIDCFGTIPQNPFQQHCFVFARAGQFVDLCYVP